MAQRKSHQLARAGSECRDGACAPCSIRGVLTCCVSNPSDVQLDLTSTNNLPQQNITGLWNLVLEAMGFSLSTPSRKRTRLAIARHFEISSDTSHEYCIAFMSMLHQNAGRTKFQHDSLFPSSCSIYSQKLSVET